MEGEVPAIGTLDDIGELKFGCGPCGKKYGIAVKAKKTRERSSRLSKAPSTIDPYVMVADALAKVNLPNPLMMYDATKKSRKRRRGSRKGSRKSFSGPKKIAAKKPAKQRKSKKAGRGRKSKK
jgi:hypothetical protein